MRNDRENYRKVKIWTISLTIISILEYIVSSIWQNYSFLEDLRLTVLFVGVFVLPVLMYGAWAILAFQYLEKRYYICKENGNILVFGWSVINALLLFCAGVQFINSLKSTITYLADNFKILDGIYKCILIKVGLTLGWLICAVCYMKCNVKIEEGRIAIRRYVLFAIAMVIVCVILGYKERAELYVLYETESVWTKKMIEYYDENGMGPDVPPFSRR